jgi:hypothetical protein
LTWTNPADADLSGVIVRFRTDGYPTGPADGQPVCEHLATPGAADTCSHSGLAKGTRYFYAAFASDDVPNYSPAARTEVYIPTPADLDGDGDVDQVDFGLLQACYGGPGIGQTDPSCADARLDADGDVDFADLGVFGQCVSGPGTPAEASCAD